MPVKKRHRMVSGYCALCGKGFRIGSAYDLVTIDGKPRAVCKGGCDKEKEKA